MRTTVKKIIYPYIVQIFKAKIQIGSADWICLDLLGSAGSAGSADQIGSADNPIIYIINHWLGYTLILRFTLSKL
jgi:hypothetical protein